MKLQFHEKITTLHEYHFFCIRLIVYNAIILHIIYIFPILLLLHTLYIP